MPSVDIDRILTHLDAIDRVLNSPPYRGRHNDARDAAAQMRRAMENIAADYAGSDYQLHIDRINRIKGLFNSCYYDAVEEKESALPERETNRPWWRFWR